MALPAFAFTVSCMLDNPEFATNSVDFLVQHFQENAQTLHLNTAHIAENMETIYTTIKNAQYKNNNVKYILTVLYSLCKRTNDVSQELELERLCHLIRDILDA